MNLIRLNGRLLERLDVRYTPAGIEVFEATLQYAGQEVEAGVTRELSFEVPVVAFGEIAHRLNAVELGSVLNVSGFLAPRYRRGKKLIVHITEYF